MESAIRRLTVFVLLFSGHLLAQTSRRGNVFPHSYFLPTTQDSQPNTIENAPNLYTIFSNLGEKPHCYDTSNGWDVAGKQSILQNSQSIAMSFTPQADATVTEIKLPLVYLQGERGGMVSLNEDNNGLPGAPIHKWTISKLAIPPCSYSVVKSQKGLSVKQGTRYWVVASAKRTELDGWAYTYSGTKGKFAYDFGSEGWEIQYSYLSAFAVLGTLQ